MPEETIYLLEKDGMLLARMPLREVEMFAFHCMFKPTPEFEPYRALFDEDAALANALSGNEEPELLERSNELTEQIHALGFTIRREGGGIYRDFLLGIDGDQAGFRPLDPTEEPYDPV